MSIPIVGGHVIRLPGVGVFAPGLAVQPPSGAPVTLVSFAGPAGPTTGAQTATALPGRTSWGSPALDGTGGLVCPSGDYQYAVLAQAPSVPVTGILTARFESGAAQPLTLGRMDAAGLNGAYVLFIYDRILLVQQYRGIETVVATISNTTLTGHATVGVRMMADGSWVALLDGTDQTPSFVPFAIASGFALIGSSVSSGSTRLAAIIYQDQALADAAYVAAHPPAMTITGIG